jgi:hypothetical protein
MVWYSSKHSCAHRGLVTLCTKDDRSFSLASPRVCVCVGGEGGETAHAQAHQTCVTVACVLKLLEVFVQESDIQEVSCRSLMRKANHLLATVLLPL